MKIQMQNTDKIFFSKPYAKYKSIVTHFTSRKSTAIEWMILELIKRYSADNEYANISLKTIIENMLYVPDTDILVKPSIIELVEINAIEDKNNSIDENISLDRVSLSYLSLTQSGRELQERGLIPGKESEEEIIFIYDKLENDLKLEADNKIDLKKEHKGIELSNDFDSIFDENRAREILEEKKDKGKFTWLQPTSEIKSIDKGESEILWRDLSDEIDIGENGKLELINYKDKETFNKLLIENIDNLFKKLENIEIKEFQPFDYCNFQNLLNIFSAESIPDKIKSILNNRDFVIVNDNFKELINYETINTNLLLIYGKENFSIDIKDKKMIVNINENMPFDNCVALNKDKTNLCIADFEVYNDFGKKNIILGYSCRYNNDFNNLEEELINKYIYYDARIILLCLFISKDNNIFKNKVVEHFNNIKEIEDALNFLQSIINEAKKIKLNDNEAKNIIVNIISKNNKVNEIKDIEKLKKYLNILNNKKILDNDSLNKVYINIIKDNDIYAKNLEELESFYDTLKEYRIPFKDIEAVIKNLYRNSFVDMIIKYMNNTEYRYEELSLTERQINSFANNIKNLSSSLQLKEKDLFKIISPSDLGKRVIEFYRNSNNKDALHSNNKDALHSNNKDALHSNNKDALLNNINNIDKIISEISSRLGIKRESFKENKTVGDTLKNIEIIKPVVYQFNDKSVNNFNKIYVIDANILMKEPKIFDYLNNNSLMVIPNIVVEELDKLKSNKDENKKRQAFQARESIRNILNNNKPNIRQEDSDGKILPDDFEKDKPDNLILSVALKFIVKDVYLLTDDNNLSAKAKGQKIKYISLEDFKNLKNSAAKNSNIQNNNQNHNNNKKNKKK